MMALIVTCQLGHVRKKREQTGRLEGKEGGRGRNEEEKKREIVLMLHG